MIWFYGRMSRRRRRHIIVVIPSTDESKHRHERRINKKIKFSPTKETQKSFLSSRAATTHVFNNSYPEIITARNEKRSGMMYGWEKGWAEDPSEFIKYPVSRPEKKHIQHVEEMDTKRTRRLFRSCKTFTVSLTFNVLPPLGLMLIENGKLTKRNLISLFSLMNISTWTKETTSELLMRHRFVVLCV